MSNNFKAITADSTNGLNNIFTTKDVGISVVSYAANSPGAPSNAWGLCFCFGNGSACSQLAVSATAVYHI